MKTRNIFLVILLGMLILVQPATAAPKKGTFTVGDKTFLLNGQPFVVKAASLSAYPASLLGASHQDVQGAGYECRLHLHFLEHP